MYWGQLVTTKARDEYNCVLSTCEHQILPGEKSYGLVVRNRGGAMFTRRAHRECLLLYLDEAELNRERSIRERRGLPRPSRDYQLTDEQRRRRQTVMQYLSFTRGRLIAACRAQHPERIKKAKATILRNLAELQSGDLGPMVKFKFGEDLIELLEAGADPTISAEEARAADAGIGIEATLELLNPGKEIHQELIRDIIEELPKPRKRKKSFVDSLKDSNQRRVMKMVEGVARDKWPSMSDEEIEAKLLVSYEYRLKENDWNV